MRSVQFAPDSPEAIAAMRCAEETVTIPGYGIVNMAEISNIDGCVTVTVHFLDSPTQPKPKSDQI